MWLAENRSPWGKSSEVIEMVEMVPVSVILGKDNTGRLCCCHNK